MKPSCPSCGTSFSVFYRLRIINPWRHRCRFCGTLISIDDRKGAMVFIGACVLGLAIPAFSITMERAGLWITRDSLIFFSLCLLLLVPVCIWLIPSFRYVVLADTKGSYFSQWPRILLCALTALAVLMFGAGLIRMKAREVDKLPEREQVRIQRMERALAQATNEDQLKKIAAKSLEFQSGLASLLESENQILEMGLVIFMILGSLNVISLLLVIVSAKRSNNGLQSDDLKALRR
jgi:hypothetical protein